MKKWGDDCSLTHFKKPTVQRGNALYTGRKMNAVGKETTGHGIRRIVIRVGTSETVESKTGKPL